MSFSSLPTELVRQIIESSVPSTFHSTTHKDRQSTLRSLCLVSRQIRSIAQPLLSEAILIRSYPKSATVNALLANEASRRHVRHFAMADAGNIDTTGETMGRFIRNYHQLRTLSLGRDVGPSLDLTGLEDLLSTLYGRDETFLIMS